MKLNRFIKNSDYTAEKQQTSFTLTLPNQTISVGGGSLGSRYVEFTVPQGIYFENITWQSTVQTGSNHYVGNYLEYEPNDMMSVVVYTIAQVSPTKYRLTGSVQNWDSSSHNYTVGASAKVHLSISPF